MDKTMKRVVGYVKPKAEPAIKKTVSFGTVKFNSGVLETDDEKVIKALDNHRQNASLPDCLEKSKFIAAWIISHPEFKWSAMCQKLKIDKANFQRAFKANPPLIKESVIPQIENFLKDYGYVR